jgi:hypothetical protein
MCINTVKAAFQVARGLLKNQIDTTIKRADDYLLRRVPYLLGGKTPDGLDCSGLITQCYPLFLPDGAQKQFEHLKRWLFINSDICFADRGDLAFFANKNDPQNVSHVGIVTEIINRRVFVIHSSEKLKAVSKNELHLDHNEFRIDYICVGIAKMELFLFHWFLEDEINKEAGSGYRISF